MIIDIPANAKMIMETLTAQGFEAYAVGGCVRNALLGLTPHDWDICTNAKPAQLQQVFAGFRTHAFGLKHGTLAVTVDGDTFEITTYRIDGVYADHRHPEQVTFTDDLTLDLSRRDFTVNAMAYNDGAGVMDPFGGMRDLQDRVLRCVGVPENRFREDALRILRGLRFAAVYGFRIEPETAAAIRRCARLLQTIAAERVREELLGMLCGAQAAAVLTEFRDVLAVVLPEVTACFDFPQHTPHHCYDVWEHIVHSVAAIDSDPLLRMTMLLHDVGKPRACTVDRDGRTHFKGHPQISADMAENILRRLRVPNVFAQTCLRLILFHDVRFNGSQRLVRRVLAQLGEENMRRLFAVQRADVAAQSDYFRSEKLAAIDVAEQQATQILAEQQCLHLRDLAISGSDLLKIGYPENSTIGKTLHQLLNAVVDEQVPNDKQALLQLARKLKNSME